MDLYSLPNDLPLETKSVEIHEEEKNKSLNLTHVSANIDNEEENHGLIKWWERLTRAGLAEVILRLGTHVLLLAFTLTIIWILPKFFMNYISEPITDLTLAASAPTLEAVSYPSEESVQLSTEFFPPGIYRTANLHTEMPNRPRFAVIKYTVKQGDTLFGIAEKFNLEPETILWANQYVLGDNPHNLLPGQEINILPVNGTYYKWQVGDGLNGVASFFGVSPDEIVNWPGNNLDPAQVGDYAHPNIPTGTWLVIPGGKRAFVTWSAPEIPRDNPEVAKVLGPGACSDVSDGAIGIAMFIWPANNRFLSGYNYNPRANHFGIDIDGDEGDPVYAVDNGVIVYAGWNNWGYGNVIVINHGNGWQTLYAHLSAITVNCGQSVWQGNLIGAIGNTGKSSGAHLHFEMMYNGTKVNPWDYLP